MHKDVRWEGGCEGEGCMREGVKGKVRRDA